LTGPGVDTVPGFNRGEAGTTNGVETTAEAIAERLTGTQPSRFKSFLAATVVGFTTAALTYRLLRRGAETESEEEAGEAE
jgi:hypothetical protein